MVRRPKGFQARQQGGVPREADERAIVTLYSHYCNAVDRRDRRLLRSVYWPDARDDHGLFAGSRDQFVSWLFPYLRQTFSSIQHCVQYPVITFRQDRAFSLCGFHTAAILKTQEQGGVRLAYGRYLDALERRRGKWRISSRVVVYDLILRLPGAVDPLPTSRDVDSQLIRGVEELWLGVKISGLSDTSLWSQR